MTPLDVALIAVRVAIGVWLLWSVRIIGPPRAQPTGTDPDPFSPGAVAAGAGGSTGAARSVSVIVPARNEAESLPALLASLPDDVEVIVVDDHSTDATAAVAAAAGARVVASAPLPADWIGKSWACQQGAAVASGDVLVFVDADVRFAPGGLDPVLDARAECGGLVSVQPFHRPGRPVESLASVFNVVAFAGTDAATPLGHHRGMRGAFGPVLATSRADYDAAGGHASIRSSIVDDVALADRYRTEGRPVRIWAGGRHVSIRMYPDGLAQMVEGFTKNLSTGVRSVRAVTTGLVAAWITLLVQAAVLPVRAVVAADTGLVVAALVLYLVVAAQYWWMACRLGRFGPLVALVFPASVALFLVVFARSVWATATGRITWRGRRLGPAR